MNGEEVHQSCGTTFQNKHYIFGGNSKKKQILELKDCVLINVGLLEFDHHRGACGSNEEVLVLCFNFKTSDYKRCRQAESPTGPWIEVALSTYEHGETAIATSPGN